MIETKSEREKLIDLVHNYIDKNPGVIPSLTWARIYHLLSIQKRQNIQVISKQKKMKPLDYIEKEGLISDALTIAESILKTGE